MRNSEIIDQMLSVLKMEVLPLTAEGTEKGNKIFGAAILLKSDLSLVVAGTNEETVNPLYHGEISCLNKFWALPEQKRPHPKECLFLSTHEPCSLCLSAITWSGFDNFYYLFSYEDSRDEFNIPHDLKILDEVFNCKEGNYSPSNAYWTSYYLIDLIKKEDKENKDKMLKKVSELCDQYYGHSSKYQDRKHDHNIPLK